MAENRRQVYYQPDERVRPPAATTSSIGRHHLEVKHHLMVDDHFTWWDCGRSYLCRIIDMLHMGYVDEVLFGREVIDRMPRLVKEWVKTARARA